ncbi:MULTISPECIES: hypothetical protein [Paenibacillus]|uniref:HK97 gp10 family phage protein n=2 Tax=Paenibacillus TaxID=44249 RepID=A0A919XLZ9_9BACL|nr:MULTISPECIES: hypothetical protein [Paenibacillus]GIO33255.1 hypothetical protein J2TS6_43960 [Paenibacillus albilobatus]GIO47977.1 hypothetical protein J34TS1_27420 [Paenibacillus azoreducens]
MSFGSNALEHIKRKRAGTLALVDNLSRKAEGDMKAAAPWKDRTATARRALHSGVEPAGKNKIRMFLAHGVRYGGILEEGSKPHIIRAKNKKALYWKGASHPVKAVRHPGTKPRAIVQPTAKKYKVKVRDTLVKWWSTK